jgi:hypothetical protein
MPISFRYISEEVESKRQAAETIERRHEFIKAAQLYLELATELTDMIYNGVKLDLNHVLLCYDWAGKAANAAWDLSSEYSRNKRNHWRALTCLGSAKAYELSGYQNDAARYYQYAADAFYAIGSDDMGAVAASAAEKVRRGELERPPR